MKKWVISAVIYVLVVVGGFTAYDGYFAKEVANSDSASQKTHETSEHGHESRDSKDSEVKPSLFYKDGLITITLEDQYGKPVDNLLINHEKLLHLILVNEHLDQYYHLHPEKTGKGRFEILLELEEGDYKAFIDIQPEKLSYHVNPLLFSVGKHKRSHDHHPLLVDQTLTKTIDGKTVELSVSSLNAGEPVTLSFKMDETTLEPYLGATGHVVILDKDAKHYLHVHPINTEKPIFETEFHQPGIYKIWAEFKQEGKVRVFPFIIEIK
ncbi:FixH family protein [Neobacillus thermocopriae]|uniref:Secreted protein n=1 Tax=Neobacillus thermocopriae TaxID=1215031 RepID=A0A6B3TM58_9BACI|nr:FixH family protein [Neobacillus thermocopriae]MED3623972.1 FixH family protein [Neobacillus thermocopriae]MED3713833.1 FixH family protein [Neobacillus thermocopriae]NEX78025.1 hypothetical protein [Neobacillus thermocopriae]